MGFGAYHAGWRPSTEVWADVARCLRNIYKEVKHRALTVLPRSVIAAARGL